MDLGSAIKDNRKRKGLTQKDFAIKCGISQTYLSQIENNLKDPNLSTIKTIGMQLGIPLPILFFMSLTEEDIQPQKRDMFKMLDSTVKSMVNEVFTV